MCGRRREAKVRRWKEKVNDIRKRARERKLKGRGVVLRWRWAGGTVVGGVGGGVGEGEAVSTV